MKTVKFSVALVLRDDKGQILAVKRPSDDDLLPNLWGLPAVTVKGSELPEAAAKRVGQEKLCCGIEVTGFVGIKHADRGDYDFILMDLEAKVTDGEPKVINSTSKSTRYADQKWVEDLSIFNEAARKGSLCSQILLESMDIKY